MQRGARSGQLQNVASYSKDSLEKINCEKFDRFVAESLNSPRLLISGATYPTSCFTFNLCTEKVDF